MYERLCQVRAEFKRKSALDSHTGNCFTAAHFSSVSSLDWACHQSYLELHKIPNIFSLKTSFTQPLLCHRHTWIHHLLFFKKVASSTFNYFQWTWLHITFILYLHFTCYFGTIIYRHLWCLFVNSFHCRVSTIFHH